MNPYKKMVRVVFPNTTYTDRSSKKADHIGDA